MPNLLDLIKNDAGAQELLANAKQLLTGAARGVTTDLAGGPIDLSNLVLGLVAGKGFKGLTDAPVGGSKSIRKATGQPAEDTPVEALGNLLTAVLPNPGAVGHAAPLLLGAIRQGGDPTLNMSHVARAGQLLRTLEKSPQLNSISVGISKDNVRPFDVVNGVTMLLNPVSHQFDPATNRINQLINRDMYASRAKDLATLRVNRNYPYDYRMHEGNIPGELYGKHPNQLDTGQIYGNGSSYSQELAIAASPSFRSFKEYEKSDKGAKLLTNNYDDITTASNAAADEFTRVFAEIIKDTYGHAPTDLHAVAGIAASHSDPAVREMAAKAIRGVQKVPSGYAELKMGGSFEVSPDTVTAIFAPAHMDPLSVEEMQKRMARAGYIDVPVARAQDLVGAGFNARYDDLATMLGEVIKKARKDDKLSSSSNRAIQEFAAQKLPQSLGRYLNDGFTYSLGDYISGSASKQDLADSIKATDAYEADVASFLNAIKLDSAK